MSNIPAEDRGSAVLWLLGCNLIVFASNICIMVLELTASRLIAHHIGQSLYTWTGVIGVVLAGITIGNYIGGGLADRFNHIKLLAVLFLLAAVTTASALLLDVWMERFSRPESMEWPIWVLVVVSTIFLAPAVALGTISPVVASLALTRFSRSGFTVGNVYAWAALGSIVGTFLTGFYLIDNFGTQAIISGTAVALLVMGAIPSAVILIELFKSRRGAAEATEPAGPIGEIAPMELDELDLRPVGSWWFLMGCNLIVFTTSVGIMTLELSATRLLAHHIGQSLYTWTSVIGVVLAGITIGNYIGGLLADRYDHRHTLGWLFLIASVHCFLVLWLDQMAYEWLRTDPPWVLEPLIWFSQLLLEQGTSEQASWPVWVFTQVAAVYGPPAAAMGTISPVVAAMALSKSRKTGATVGNVYAWATLGSIIGTFLAGFWLIDLFGTRALIVMTAAMLGIAGACTAAKGSMLRPVLIFGWLQFLFFFGLAAAAKGEALEAAGGAVGEVLSIGKTEEKEEETKRIERWKDIGFELGRVFHDLGTSVALRNDEQGRYEDESNYSYITIVEEDDQDGSYKYLKLDKLVHSYYVPGDPKLLRYEYELVYAAVAERAKSTWDSASVAVRKFAGRDAVVANLPAGVHFNASDGRLTATRLLNENDRQALLRQSPVAEWWLAVEELHHKTTADDWPGFSAANLAELPGGTWVPPKLEGEEKIRFHSELLGLSARIVVNVGVRDQLIAAAPMEDWYRAVNRLFAVRTMFIGGGGFVFPRWIEVMFPVDPVIDVAELDPAVLLAVQRELGLDPDGLISRSTSLGDARNFVEDQLRKTPRPQYDFIFGDAFNDFSVPWHLTTREFTSDVKDLLDPDRGIYLVNIIDIYPRTQEPPYESSSVGLPVKIPVSWTANANEEDWTSVPERPGLEILQVDNGRSYSLAVRGTVPDTLKKQLLADAGSDTAVKEIIDRLSQRAARPMPATPLKPRRERGGHFLAAYALTLAAVYDNVYVFSSESGVPHRNRDTFVLIASNKPLDLSDLFSAGGHWRTPPFAWREKEGGLGTLSETDNQWESVTGWAARQDWRGVLTDNFAPVDRLLRPVFLEQDD